MEPHRRLTWRFALVCLSGLMALTPQMKAQEVEGVGIAGPAAAVSRRGRALSSSASPSNPETWGTGLTSHTIQAFAFNTLTSTMGYTGSGLVGGLACNGAACVLTAPVFLPAGALVVEVEVEACDTHVIDSALVLFTRSTSPAGALTNVAVVETTGSPGCDFFTVPISPPEEIDNYLHTYFLQVGLGATTATRLYAVRLFYRLQVSPAPLGATFSDVPVGHPYHRFVEALFRSGITSGCGGGQFCVNNPITRGEMAVFMAAALGLQFAP